MYYVLRKKLLQGNGTYQIAWTIASLYRTVILQSGGRKLEKSIISYQFAASGLFTD